MTLLAFRALRAFETTPAKWLGFATSSEQKKMNKNTGAKANRPSVRSITSLTSFTAFAAFAAFTSEPTSTARFIEDNGV
jgi:hypothetical protein